MMVIMSCYHIALHISYSDYMFRLKMTFRGLKRAKVLFELYC